MKQKNAHAIAPQQDSVLTPAPLLRWLMAMLYDGILVFCLWLLLGVVVIALNPAHTLPTYSMRLIMALSTSFYFLYCWTRTGQTLGALAWGLRVVPINLAQKQLSLGQSLIRLMTALISLGLGGLGHLWRCCDAKQQSVYDHLSKTRVIRSVNTSQ